MDGRGRQQPPGRGDDDGFKRLFSHGFIGRARFHHDRGGRITHPELFKDSEDPVRGHSRLFDRDRAVHPAPDCAENALQPLVENALYHGIKNKRGGGCIVLRGYEDRNGLVFEVEDDGIGMDEAELAAVRAKLTLEPEEELAPIGSGGFGLHNVAQRIQMYYGDQAEILVESEKNIGTCFKVYLGNQKKS